MLRAHLRSNTLHSSEQSNHRHRHVQALQRRPIKAVTATLAVQCRYAYMTRATAGGAVHTSQRRQPVVKGPRTRALHCWRTLFTLGQRTPAKPKPYRVVMPFRSWKAALLSTSAAVLTVAATAAAVTATAATAAAIVARAANSHIRSLAQPIYSGRWLVLG